MKENKELERNDIAIDRDMEVDYDIGQEIMVYIETWFDVDKKFGLNIADEDGTWLNMYGKYDPFTEAESALIKNMIAEKIREQWDQTPQEFCENCCNEEQTMGGLT